MRRQPTVGSRSGSSDVACAATATSAADAAMVMLGVAAERVFDLLCESMATSAVMNPRERVKLEASMKRSSIKPRIDIVHEKFQQIQNAAGFPESATLM